MPGSGLALAPLQLTALSVWLCVSRRDVGSFGRALEFLQTVAGGAPGLVSPRHLAKLLLGLRAKMILDMFRQNCPPGDIRRQLGHLFPPEADTPAPATLRDSQKIREIQQQFRHLVLHLLSDSSFRASFLEVEAEEQYGEQFLVALDKLLWEFLLRLQRVGACPRLQPSCPPEQQPVVGVLFQLPPRCLQLLLSSLGTTPSLHPGTLLLLSDGARTDPPPSCPGRERSARQEARRRGSRTAAPWDGGCPPGGQRAGSLRGAGGAGICAGRQRRRRARRGRDPGGRRGGRLGAPEAGDGPDTELGGPGDAEAADVVSDSEGESSGRRPLRLYQRTRHNTLIPTLLQHLGPPAASSRRLSPDGMPNPGVN